MNKNGVLEQKPSFWAVISHIPKGTQNTFLKGISVDKSQEKMCSQESKGVTNELH